MSVSISYYLQAILLFAISNPIFGFQSHLRRPPTAFALSTKHRTKNPFSLTMSAVNGSQEPNHVVVVGSANQDLTSYTRSVPVMGETVMGQHFETSCGGKGANQAVAAAKLDIAAVTMLCRVAADSFGSDLLHNFRQASVQFDESTTVVKEDGAHTGVASIVVDTQSGDNMIIVSPGTNYKLTPEQVTEAIVGMDVPPKAVVVQLEILPEAALAAVKAGKQVGATTILNTAPAPIDWTLDEFYPFVDILIPNETELRTLLGSTASNDEEAMARTLLDKGVQKAVIVTLGARGAMVVAKSDDGSDIEVTIVNAPDDLPCRNDPVKDTIGAGDAFCGALSAYLSAGLSLEEAATKACGVASMSVRKVGAQSSYPSADQLPECLKMQVPAVAAK